MFARLFMLPLGHLMLSVLPYFALSADYTHEEFYRVSQVE